MRLLLAALLVLSASVANAVVVDPNSEDGVAALWLNDAFAWALCTDGNVYRMYSAGQGWIHVENQLPVPVNQMRDWCPYYIRTVNGQIWQGTPTLEGDDWVVIPSIPCVPPVASSEKSYGGVKGLFR